jgi:hypothetical protein
MRFAGLHCLAYTRSRDPWSFARAQPRQAEKTSYDYRLQAVNMSTVRLGPTPRGTRRPNEGHANLMRVTPT